MSSCIRRYSQIPDGIRFFTTIPDSRIAPYVYFSRLTLDERLAGVPVPYTRTGNVVETATPEDMRVLYCNNGAPPYEFVGINNMDWYLLYDTVSPPVTHKPFLLKDLGQTIDFKINGLLAIQWRLVQIISGPRAGDGSTIWDGTTSEGVPANYPAGGEGWVVTYLESSPNNPGTSYYRDTVGVMRVG